MTLRAVAAALGCLLLGCGGSGPRTHGRQREMPGTPASAVCRQYKPGLDEYRGQLEHLIYSAPSGTEAAILGVKGSAILSRELDGLSTTGIPRADMQTFERWTADLTHARNILEQVGGMFDLQRVAVRDLGRADRALADAAADQSGLGLNC